ncbi:DUF2617 family protein [Brevibacterium sp. UCMA 11754]|uniref:DUF2617 family protein n=1 Tax=Brevibacterium sp. UCMA 11754 TaxID=2749198 RepID=UPI001F46B764|nr:DUF2617 family protein [Brevibacterium sp. UCMA 11754]MCF2571662.1 DUF2617 family protein [Brevibacterium sp. UCMA 11754]
MTLTPPLTGPVPTQHVSLDVAFADTSAQALTFSLDHGRITPLASDFIDLPSSDGQDRSRLELHVIGSSHQVILSENDADSFIETFACLGEDERPGWDTTRTTAGTWSGFTRHQFRCELTDVAGSFSDAAAEVVARSSAHDRHLVVDFPGEPGALTALALTDMTAEQVSWQSWHCYPQHRQIVHSHSQLRRRS